MLESLDYNVVQAEDGQQALEMIASSGAQIVLSDLHMPKLNGIELTKKVRELKLDHYVHIIMITGEEEDELRAEAIEAGVDDFLTKGQSLAVLKARLRVASRLVQHAEALSENARILRETHERLEQDLLAAANAQRQLLPDIDREILGFRIASSFVPSSIVSGDMFGCFPLNDSQLAFYTVDVSGHGVHASLLSVAIGHLITPEFFRTKVLANADTPDPAALVSDLNQRFSAMDNDDYFTMFCGVIDNRTGRLDYCQAAYPSPLCLSPTGAIELVGDGGFPVGMFPHAEFENNSRHFDCGCALFICSDAVHEAENDDRLPFGNDRLRDIARKFPTVGVEGLPDLLVQSLTNWRNNHPLEDDLTIVALERTKPHDTH